MDNLKKYALRACGVITAAVCVPMILLGGINIFPSVIDAVSNACKSSAALSFGDNTAVFKSIGNAINATIIDTPSTDYGNITINNNSKIAIDMAPNETQAGTNSSNASTIIKTDELAKENPLPYVEDQEENCGAIERATYGVYDDTQFITLDSSGQVRNCTTLSNEYLLEESRESPDFTIDTNSDEPQVLIYHTHTTESFEPYTRDFYDTSFTSKTTDETKNMVEVGERICEQLNANGIGYVHAKTIHDYPDYNSAYDLSYATVASILEEYPTIKVVLDIHRDAIERSDGTRIAPVCEVDGKSAAQLMIISCADDGSGYTPEYMKNFHLACALQNQLEEDYPELARPVLFDYRNYNQSLSTGALLIEIGAHGNSLEEAFYTGELLGKSLSKLLLGL
ncbi:MAG: stage II sporulation protein P [Ruminococcus sp.]|nr:stage II sporulation protein P [Ruminococcus sp.]